ncbi:ubiquitin carboxyl-terminal hydrolase 3-like [Lytechinus variegatus]|uniref:ubiquitin carboxyl-terminal hydrolase 3-like n=1 Tax=Lytechinus variegatus TaxID=7654 RepID=UPI001BB23EB0|nr:ubiquitin carboxyl-terminal hydrolase 3-like [Lytechinus variegatus]
MECPHLSHNVKQEVCEITKKSHGESTSSWVCAVCRSNKSPWMCLACGVVLCGRYVNGHAKKHFEENQHSASINCENLAVYCYVCDDHALNDNKTETIKRVRQLLQAKVNLQYEKQLKSLTGDVAGDHIDGPPRKKLAANTRANIPGLRNLGNTCFMNAVLQSLSNINQFCGYFKDLPAVELRSGKTAGKRIYNTRNMKHDDVSLVEEIRKTLCALWQGDQTAISPDSLFSVMWKIFPRFRGYQQQDAHEFMRYLLDRLHTELQGSHWPTTPRKQTNGHPTIVSLIFGGLLLSEVTCRPCGSLYKKIDPFLDVSLDIPERFRPRSKNKDGSQVCRLQDCLYSFIEVEELEETEQYMCPKCQQRQPSTKKFWLKAIPNVLCIHLKRFTWSGFLRTKIDTYVQFPMKGLDIQPYMLGTECQDENVSSTVYDLAAVIVHQGSGAGAGHYIAFAVNNGQWYCFNDSTVTPVEEKVITRCKAYILFYVSHQFKDDFLSFSSIHNGNIPS